jgi:hypothetical protein
MAQTIKLKRSAEQGNEPTLGQLALGELAINTYDGLLFIRKDDGTASIIRVNDRDTDDLSEGSTNLYFTAQRVRDEIDGNPLDEIDYIDFAVQSAPSYAEGRVFYDNVNKALAVYNSEADITLQVGQEEYLRVYNNTGSTLTNGTPVYATGSFEGTPTVDAADATTETKARVEGVVTHSIENNSYGFVTVRGMVSDIDTSGLTAGYPIHVAADGSLQTAAPTYPYYATDIGGCIISHASTGKIYVRIQHHTFETIRVSGNSHLDGNLTVDGDLTVNGTQSIVSQNNLSVDNSFVYLNSGDTIGEANTTFTGTGLDDAYFRGHYEGTTSKTFYVRIDGVGTGTGGVDTFEWSYDDFSTTEATGVDITGATQTLGENITIFFNATTGHTSGDVWSGSASPVNADSGWFSNRNTGTSGVGYTHMGIFFDVSDEKFKVVSEYGPEPEGTIDTTDASYTTGTLVGDFEGSLALTGAITGTGSVNISGDITTSGTVTASALSLGDDTEITWNADEGTIDIAYDGVTLQVGQEQHLYLKASVALTNGDVVAFNGAQGGHMLGTKADITDPNFKDYHIIGVCTEDIALGEFGYVTTYGKVRGVDTSAYAEGAILYLSNTPGQMTSTKPTAPDHALIIAAVVRSHANQGTILVRPTPGSHIEDLHDVGLGTLSNGDRLQWNATTERFENVSNDMSELNNDMWEVTSTVPTDGTGKPTGYVWYIV